MLYPCRKGEGLTLQITGLYTLETLITRPIFMFLVITITSIVRRTFMRVFSINNVVVYKCISRLYNGYSTKARRRNHQWAQIVATELKNIRREDYFKAIEVREYSRI